MSGKESRRFPEPFEDYSVEEGVIRVGDEAGVEIRWRANLNLYIASSEFTSQSVAGGPRVIVYEKDCQDWVPDFWDAAPYIDGWVKFDGCFHLNFADDGYIHLCGMHGFEQFSSVLHHIKELAENHTDV